MKSSKCIWKCSPFLWDYHRHHCIKVVPLPTAFRWQLLRVMPCDMSPVKDQNFKLRVSLGQNVNLNIMTNTPPASSIKCSITQYQVIRFAVTWLEKLGKNSCCTVVRKINQNINQNAKYVFVLKIKQRNYLISTI